LFIILKSPEWHPQIGVFFNIFLTCKKKILKLYF
jgi:hypothetical protein